jgi:hypothetical protein
MKVITVVALVLILATSVYGLEKKAFQMREDFGTEPMYDCYMNYYYYIPCTTSSWFWMQYGWAPGDIIGVFYTVGDPTMGVATTCSPAPSCDPCNAHTIQQFRILDFAGYGTMYPGLYTTQFSIYCSDQQGCPIGAPLWTSDPQEFCAAGWNYVLVEPNVCVTTCHSQPGAPYCYPTFLITAQMIGSTATYPAFGMDNISTPIGLACVMHDTGCCPALYPRPAVSHYATMHTGYYGTNAFTYCPPLYFVDGADTTGGTTFGGIELAWRVYLINSGPTATEPSTWGNIKSMYR